MNKWNRLPQKTPTIQLVTRISMVASLPYLAWQTLHKNVIEFDALHHGLIFPAAVAVSEGLVPHLQVFAQYGPLNPLLQGLWLHFSEATVFHMQSFTALLAGLIALCLFLICRLFLGLTSSYLLAVTWIVTGPHGLPWASLPTNLFIMVAVLLLFMQSPIRPNRKMYYSLDFLAGVIMSFAVFGRIQSLLVVFTVSCLLTYLRRRRGLVFFAGCLFSITTGILFLYFQGAAGAFFNECVLWAAQTLGYAEVPKISKAFFFDISWFVLLPLSFLLLVFLSNFLSRKGSKIKLRLLFLSLGLLSIALGIISNRNLNGFHPNLSEKSTDVKLEYLAIVASRKYLFSIDYLPLFIFLSIFFFSLYRVACGLLVLSEIKWIAIVVGFACLPQMWPIADSYHMWFLSPILISCSVVLGSDLSFLGYRKYLKAYLLLLLLGLQVQSFVDFSKPRYSFSNNVLQGMYSSLEDAPIIDKTMSLLEKSVTTGSTRFECPDGIYSSSDGSYNSIDANFVNWSSRVGLTVTSFDSLFLCRANDSMLRNFELLGWNVVFQIPYTSNSDLSNILLRRKNT